MRKQQSLVLVREGSVTKRGKYEYKKDIKNSRMRN